MTPTAGPAEEDGEREVSADAAVAVPPAPDTGPTYQADVIWAGNLVFAGVTTLAVLFAYGAHRDPPWFYIGAVSVVFIFALASRVDSVAQWVGNRLKSLGEGEEGEAYKPGPLWQRYSSFLDERQGAIVYVLAGLTVVSLVALIFDTGLSIESPFIPFVTAPAVFGPFIAKNGRRARLLVGTAALVLLIITLVASPSPCGVGGCPAPTLRDELSCASAPSLQQCAVGRVEDRFRPRRWLYLANGVLVLVAAGLIGARRLQTEQRLRADARKAESEAAVLRRQLAEPGGAG